MLALGSNVTPGLAQSPRLERIFESLRDDKRQPAGYAVIDGDKPSPGPGKPQANVKFIRLECRESENLYLTDQVLEILGTSWGPASTAITAATEKYGKKAPLLKTAVAWDRQQHDLKNVINEISSILDSKNVHWTQRVGVAIGRSKPTGQLAAFLGADLINALWH